MMGWFLLNINQCRRAEDNRARLHQVDIEQEPQTLRISFRTSRCKTQDLQGPFLVFQADDCCDALIKAHQICPNILIKCCSYCCCGNIDVDNN